MKLCNHLDIFKKLATVEKKKYTAYTHTENENFWGYKYQSHSHKSFGLYSYCERLLPVQVEAF